MADIIRLKRKILLAAVCAGLLVSLGACRSGNLYVATSPVEMSGQAEYPADSETGEPSGIGAIEKILIFPFKDLAGIYGTHVNVRSPLDGNMFMTGKVEKDAADYMTERLEALMKANDAYEMIPSSQACCVVPDPLNTTKADGQDQAHVRSLFQLTVEAGLAADADAVLAGHLYRFEDRIGQKYSVDSPASVTFDLHLIKLSESDQNGRIVWTGRYEETQGPLSENFLKLGRFLKRGGKWLTAYDMAADALEDMLKTLPKKQ